MIVVHCTVIVLCLRTFWYQMHACRVKLNGYNFYWKIISSKIDSRIWREHIYQCDFQNYIQWTQTHNHPFPTPNTPSFKKKIGCSLFYDGEGLRPKSAPCLQYYMTINQRRAQTLSPHPRAGWNPAWVSGRWPSRTFISLRAMTADSSLYEWHKKQMAR